MIWMKTTEKLVYYAIFLACNYCDVYILIVYLLTWDKYYFEKDFIMLIMNYTMV